MQYRLSYLSKDYDIDVREDKGEFIVTVGQDVYRFKNCSMEGHQVRYRFEGKARRMHFARESDRYYLAVDGEYYMLERAKAVTQGHTDNSAGKNSVTHRCPVYW